MKGDSIASPEKIVKHPLQARLFPRRAMAKLLPKKLAILLMVSILLFLYLYYYHNQGDLSTQPLSRSQLAQSSGGGGGQQSGASGLQQQQGGGQISGKSSHK